MVGLLNGPQTRARLGCGCWVPCRSSEKGRNARLTPAHAGRQLAAMNPTQKQFPISTSKLLRSLSLSCLAIWAVRSGALAQAPVGLSIQTYAGLSITGAVGMVYTVQYTTNLTEPTDWQGAGIVQLPSSPHLWVDTSAPAAGRRFYRALKGPTNLVWIPPGTFTMGSPATEVERASTEGPQTVVTLTRGLFMGKYELTQGEYAEVMGSNPSYFRNGVAPLFGGSGGPVTDELRHPVETVDWYDATDYCARLTERERVARRLPAGWLYRLPTDAEWEYACRGGTTGAFHYGRLLGTGMANFYNVQWYDSSIGTMFNPGQPFLGRTTVVGSYEGNGWGLYDMHGNVLEWCSDWGSDNLPGGRVIDPQGPGPTPSSDHVLHGGHWNHFARQCRSAYRAYDGGDPGDRSDKIGFRVVLAPGQP